MTPDLGTYVHSFTCVYCSDEVWSILITMVAINLCNFPYFIKVSGKPLITTESYDIALFIDRFPHVF